MLGQPARVLAARRGEGGAVDLLGVEAQRTCLRVVLLEGEPSGHGLGAKLVVEPDHVLGRGVCKGQAVSGQRARVCERAKQNKKKVCHATRRQATKKETASVLTRSFPSRSMLCAAKRGTQKDT